MKGGRGKGERGQEKGKAGIRVVLAGVSPRFLPALPAAFPSRIEETLEREASEKGTWGSGTSLRQATSRNILNLDFFRCDSDAIRGSLHEASLGKATSRSSQKLDLFRCGSDVLRAHCKKRACGRQSPGAAES